MQTCIIDNAEYKDMKMPSNSVKFEVGWEK